MKVKKKLKRKKYKYKLTKEMIDNIFEEAEMQQEIKNDYPIFELYKIAFPDWNNILEIKGYPYISKNTNQYIFKKYIDYDKKFFPNIFKGGIWFNQGFSTCRDGLKDWKIDTKGIEVIYNS